MKGKHEKRVAPVNIPNCDYRGMEKARRALMKLEYSKQKIFTTNEMQSLMGLLNALDYWHDNQYDPI